MHPMIALDLARTVALARELSLDRARPATELPDRFHRRIARRFAPAIRPIVLCYSAPVAR